MKFTKKLLVWTLTLLITLSLVSCNAPGKAESPGYPDVNGPMADADMPMPPEGDKEGEEGGDKLVENPFIATNQQNVSTFSADVDTASYTYFRKLIQGSKYSWEALQGMGSCFRTEEFINYFRYETTAPAEGELFGVETQIVPCPWNPSTVLMRMTLQAAEQENTVGNNLVFLIDVSGSMNGSDKLGLLKEAFSYLTQSLTDLDTVSIVTYSGSERVVLEGCPGNDSGQILRAIQSLSAYGSTNGEAGLTRAYEIAERYRIEGGNNRIIMASDGDLNVGITSQDELHDFVSQKRQTGIYLSVLGFGTGNYRDSKMETLADNGNGAYYYIDGMSEAEKVFGTDLLGTLNTVAEDVKLQITFDTQYVSSYRLIGYENRMLNQEDFEDDTKDAGEVGAGHCVTVCYELTLTEHAKTAEDPWMNLDVRHKNPGDTLSVLHTYAIGAESFSEIADPDTAFVCAVIETVMLLRGSQYAGDLAPEDVMITLRGMDMTGRPDCAEFYQLLQRLFGQMMGDRS